MAGGRCPPPSDATLMAESWGVQRARFVCGGDFYELIEGEAQRALREDALV